MSQCTKLIELSGARYPKEEGREERAGNGFLCLLFFLSTTFVTAAAEIVETLLSLFLFHSSFSGSVSLIAPLGRKNPFPLFSTLCKAFRPSFQRGKKCLPKRIPKKSAHIRSLFFRSANLSYEDETLRGGLTLWHRPWMSRDTLYLSLGSYPFAPEYSRFLILRFQIFPFSFPLPRCWKLWVGKSSKSVGGRENVSWRYFSMISVFSLPQVSSHLVHLVQPTKKLRGENINWKNATFSRFIDDLMHFPS